MKYYFLFCFLLFNNIILFAQNKDAVKNSIRIKVEAINKEKNYKTVYLDQLQFMKNNTDGGGSVTGFFKNDKLVKIIRWIGISNGYTVDEYFLNKDKLIFVHEVENGFEYNDSTGEINYHVIGINFDGRYWFDNNKEIDEISLGHNRFEGDDADPEKEFLEDVKKYTSLLYKKYWMKKGK